MNDLDFIGIRRLAASADKARATIDELRVREQRELLDALRAFCGDYEAMPTTDDTSFLKAVYLHALAVIAKAEGKP